MAEEQMGLWRAFWRLLTFYGLRKQLGLVRAADRMFTGSTEGIADAFDLQRDQLVRRYNDLFDAFGQLETVLEEKRLESEALARELRDLAVKRDGALTMYERAEQAGDAEEQQKHKAAFERFQGRLKQIEVRQGNSQPMSRRRKSACVVLSASSRPCKPRSSICQARRPRPWRTLCRIRRSSSSTGVCRVSRRASTAAPRRRLAGESRTRRQGPGERTAVRYRCAGSGRRICRCGAVLVD